MVREIVRRAGAQTASAVVLSHVEYEMKTRALMLIFAPAQIYHRA
jgi:hypothetical protein